MALQHSMGQMKAQLQGSGNGAVGIQDSVSGHGLNAGDLKVYTSSAPANADIAESGTLLIDWVLPNPCMGAASSALPSVLTFNAVSDVSASNTGTAVYARFLANGDTGVLSTTERRIQCSVGAGAGDLSFNSTSIVSGGVCSFVSGTYTHPG